jgi:hypothetical protein
VGPGSRDFELAQCYDMTKSSLDSGMQPLVASKIALASEALRAR